MASSPSRLVPPRPRRGGPRWAATLVGWALWAVAWLAGPTAHAQNADSLSADPIPLAQLRLAISIRTVQPIDESHWQSVERAHDAYLEAVRAARVAVAPLVDMHRPLLPVDEDPEALRALLRDAATVQGRMTGLEATLFREISEALGEMFREAVDAVAVHRSLERLAVQHWSLTGFSVRMNLTELPLLAPALSIEDRRRIIEFARDCDRQQVDLVRSIVERSTERSVRRAQRNRDEPIARGDPDSAARWQARDAAIKSEFADIDDNLSRLFEVRRRFITRSLGALEFEARRAVRSELGHNDQTVPDPFGMERRFRACLRSPKLDQPSKDAVRELYQAWAAEEERRTVTVESTILSGASVDPKARTALQEAYTDLARPYLERLRNALPAFRFDNEVEEVWRRDPFDPVVRAADDVFALERRAASMVDDGNENADRFRMHLSVRAPDPQLILAWLHDANEVERDIVETIVRDEKAAWSSALGDRLASITTAERNCRWLGQLPNVSPASVRASLVDVTPALEAADARVTNLFTALRASLPAERAAALACAELERRLEVWVDDESLMGVNLSWEIELAPNLARVVRGEREQAGLGFEALAKALVVEAPAVVRAARSRRVGLAAFAIETLDLQREAARLEAEAIEANPGGLPAAPAELIAAREALASTTQRLLALRRKSTDDLRAALGRVVSGLDEAERASLRLAYEREAYPEAFNDRRDPTAIIERAKTLLPPDDERRAAIDALLKTHRDRNTIRVIKLIDMRRSQPAIDQPSPYELANVRNARDFFERNELHTRTIFALRRLLTADEVRRIPAAANYERLIARLGPRWWDG
jgi:hypothetical protein